MANLYSRRFLIISKIEKVKVVCSFRALTNSLYRKREAIIVPDLPIPAEQWNRRGLGNWFSLWSNYMNRESTWSDGVFLSSH